MSSSKMLDAAISLTEVFRCAIELGSGAAFKGYVNKRTQSGQGLVMMAPGFLENGFFLKSMGGFLKSKGFTVSDWGLGINLGPAKIPLDNFVDNIIEFSEQNGNQPVHLIGQSLGGVYALEAAKKLEERAQTTGSKIVGKVITLGSPLDSEKGINKVVHRLFSHFNPPNDPVLVSFKKAIENFKKDGLPDVPVSCIFSHFDGIVGGEAAKTHLVGKNKENIEVYGSHFGMAFEPLIRLVLMDRLTQSEENWKPFNPEDIPSFARMFLPLQTVNKLTEEIIQSPQKTKNFAIETLQPPKHGGAKTAGSQRQLRAV